MHLNRHGKYLNFHRTASINNKNNQIFGLLYGGYSTCKNRCLRWMIKPLPLVQVVLRCFNAVCVEKTLACWNLNVSIHGYITGEMWFGGGIVIVIKNTYIPMFMKGVCDWWMSYFKVKKGFYQDNRVGGTSSLL